MDCPHCKDSYSNWKTGILEYDWHEDVLEIVWECYCNNCKNGFEMRATYVPTGYEEEVE